MFRNTPLRTLLRIGGVVAVVAAIYLAFFNHNSDADTIRAFVAEIGAGEVATAHARLGEGVITLDALQSSLGRVAVYTDVALPSVSWSNVDGIRRSRYEGTATTDGGCTSQIVFELTNGRINFFDFRPLCRAPADAT